MDDDRRSGAHLRLAAAVWFLLAAGVTAAVVAAIIEQFSALLEIVLKYALSGMLWGALVGHRAFRRGRFLKAGFTGVLVAIACLSTVSAAGAVIGHFQASDVSPAQKWAFFPLVILTAAYNGTFWGLLAFGWLIVPAGFVAGILPASCFVAALPVRSEH